MNDETYLTNPEKANLLRHRAVQLLRESEELLRQARELERLANFSSAKRWKKPRPSMHKFSNLLDDMANAFPFISVIVISILVIAGFLAVIAGFLAGVFQ